MTRAVHNEGAGVTQHHTHSSAQMDVGKCRATFVEPRTATSQGHDCPGFGRYRGQWTGSVPPSPQLMEHMTIEIEFGEDDCRLATEDAQGNI